ncbi:hypothetical protein OIU80_19565 [Flavobacterium sp. LS1R47]|uniref:Lipoprotein n=1 Tax=Flavobacterium frigoritolerans TaxID=2987686 RepID=A0A9X3CA94_9FLAO|nr:hypothetical protein [Flavobacterium frigoritolerans]MCV9934484.1 hypothetical protein [Flavobacterium frigoritolerans]
MKRIFIVACFIATNVVFVSCTNDDVEDTINKNKLSIAADTPDDGPSDSGGDGQNGQTPIPPPKKKP